MAGPARALTPPHGPERRKVLQDINRAYDAARNRLLERVHERIRNTLQTAGPPPAPSLQPVQPAPAALVDVSALDAVPTGSPKPITPQTA